MDVEPSNNLNFAIGDSYRAIRIIGQGAYASVFEAVDTATGDTCAIKKNKQVFENLDDARRILREIKLLVHFNQRDDNHPDIIPLLDVIPPSVKDSETFNDVYLVLPKMPATLHKIIHSRNVLDERHYTWFMHQLCRGCAYMHSADVIHRDLKPENILVDEQCNIMITDFGLARGISPQNTEYVVTRHYRAPEIMCSPGNYDDAVDIWSLGCIFAELMLRRPLFPGNHYIDQLRRIFELLGTPTDLGWIQRPAAVQWVQTLEPQRPQEMSTVFPDASPAALTLLSRMLVMDPVNRSSALQCLRDPYLQDLHQESDEEPCPQFDASFESDEAILTKSGLRRMMFNELAQFKEELDRMMETKMESVEPVVQYWCRMAGMKQCSHVVFWCVETYLAQSNMMLPGDVRGIKDKEQSEDLMKVDEVPVGDNN